ncbi:MAG: SMP-30/gluconolactonase/LRE family protein [Chloracidobacterium sp.]|nr:SMP-30/gluconolactonase/LRE family protein [Chloracidobacterium sp.]
MFALLYLVLVFILGDSICRRFFTFVSIPHRLAAAFLTGVLISTWWTYFCGLLFYWTSSPLTWGNLLFFVMSTALIYWLRTRPPNNILLTHNDRSETEFRKWDWIAFGLCFLLASYLMLSTFGMKDGNMLIGIHQSSDFGSTVSIMQSFARGHNFPTEFTHFTGDKMRYHFLFYFQAGNLEYLGFSPAFANNILAILSMGSMLILVMTLGALVFGSRVVGRIAAALFFFHGTLSFYTFFDSLGWDLSAIIAKVAVSPDFIPSGYQYRGETWGVWSLVNYANQRHLASSIGIFLLALTFLIIRYKTAEAKAAEIRALEAEARAAGLRAEQERAEAIRAAEIQASLDRAAAQAAALEEQNTWSNEMAGSEPVSTFESEAEERPVFADPMQAEDFSSGSDLLELGESEKEPDSDASVEHEPTDRENFSTKTDPLEIEADSISSEAEQFENSESFVGDASRAEPKFESEPIYETPSEPVKPRKTWGEWFSEGTDGIMSFVFVGVLLGLMPMWNGAIFVSAFAVLAVLFVLFPQRRQLVALGIATAIFALPQVIFLKTGGMPDPGYSLVSWGYSLGKQATILQVLEYLGWTFGFKWLLIAIALIIGTSFQRRLFLAISSLIILTFCFQFSLEALTNHKFLNVWVVVANLYVGAGLWWLWNLRILKTTILSKIAAAILTVLVTLSGALDLYPFHTTDWGEVVYGKDPLVNWVAENTPPNSVFLSARYTSHGILNAGRKLFYGHPYYAWGAGYDTAKRDKVYVRMLESTNPQEVFDLLKENGINYVAIDNNLRKNNESIKKINEAIFEAYFDVVFEDKDNKYAKMVIYKVPDELGDPKPEIQLPPEEPRAPINPSEAVPAFRGGEGNSPGKFQKPRGITADDKGSFYVADAGNNRIQKFDVDGKFVAVFGDPGEREGKIKEPNGVATDDEGNIYVTDAGNHKLLKYNPDGTFAKEFMGPDTGFYGPRDVAVGQNKQVYIIDQGRTRVARFSPSAETFSRTWGTAGTGDGEFKDPTGIAVGDNLVFVADLGNGRIQVFDLEGQFLRQWAIPTWERTSSEFPDVVFDEQTRTVYVSSGKTNEVLAFDENGNPMSGFNSQGDEKMDNPTSLAVFEANKKRWLLVLNTNSNRVSRFELEALKTTEVPKANKEASKTTK